MPNNKKRKNHGDVLSRAITNGAFSDTFFSRSSNCFFFIDSQNKKRKLTGVNPILREIFYSKYKFDRNIFNLCMKKFGRRHKKKKETRRHNQHSVVDGIEMNIGKELGPIARGSIVHNQLEILFSDNKNKNELFEKKYGYIDPLTISAYEWMKRKDLRPIKSELSISDPDLRIGTSIDLVAQNKNGELVVIEWKTGNSDTFQFFTEKMQSGLGKIMTNCPLNQARLQLFTTFFILSEKYFVPVKTLILVHISEEKIEEYTYDAKKIHDFCGFIYEKIRKNRMRKEVR